jgi:hypothetical protein
VVVEQWGTVSLWLSDEVPGRLVIQRAQPDRTYLMLAKPNVIMNDVRLKGLAVAGSEAAGRKSPHNHVQTVRTRRAQDAPDRARVVMPQGLRGVVGSHLVTCSGNVIHDQVYLRRLARREAIKTLGRFASWLLTSSLMLASALPRTVDLPVLALPRRGSILSRRWVRGSLSVRQRSRFCLCVCVGSLAFGSRRRRREGKKRRPTVLRAHSVVRLARHDHGLELLKVLRISTPTPGGQEAQLD